MPTTTKTTRRIYTAARNATAAPAQTSVYAPAINATSASNASVSTACCCTACAGLTCLDRTRFFSGQLLSEGDLNNDQRYWLAKSRLHNRYLNGWGVVCGMQVVCGQCDGWVTVRSGYAIDPCGNDIIVCSNQNFNVLKAIQACCAPTTQTPNCSPLRYNPPAECQNMAQKWCITIQYQEQQSRMITPLQQTSSTSGSCSCGSGGSSNGGCGCGGGSQTSAAGSSSMSTCGCSSTATQTAATVPTGACEPTRIVEGFQLGIVAPPQTTDTRNPQPGTFEYQFENCKAGLTKLALMAPTINANSDPNQAYQAVCSYLTLVNQYFAQNEFVTHCSLLDTLNTIAQSLVPPASDGAMTSYQAALTSLGPLLFQAAKDCLCTALLPACPPNPCDNRLILACVTVLNGTITDICPFEGRQQLIGYTALNYWLGSVFSALGSLIDARLEAECCGQKDPYFDQTVPSELAYDRTNVTTNVVSNPASFNRIFTSFLSQQMGASLLNIVSPQMRAVDLRSLAGTSSLDAQQSLIRQGFSNVTVQKIDSDPSWDTVAITAASQFIPTAVSSGQPLTVYTKGDAVVGIEVTDPTTVLQNSVQAQVADLQTQITNLQTQLTSLQATAATGGSSAKKK
ncbi:MAG: hypothetical protein WAL56_22825 [Candidatus Sulfotelmatobacter sp.]